MVRFLGFLGGRPILPFRFRGERLPARESGVERVPPADRAFAALPAQISDLVPDPRRKIHEPAVDVFQLTPEGVHIVYVRLDGAFEIGLLLEGFRVCLALPCGCGRESFPVIRFGVLDAFTQFSQAGELRIESQEALFEARNERVRRRHREHAQQRVRVQAEIGRTSHRTPRGIYRLRRTLPFALCEAVGFTNGTGRGHHVPQLRLGLLHAPGLEATVRVDVELLRLEDGQGLLDALADQGFRLDDVAVDVDHAEGDLLLQRLALESIQEVQAGVGHLEVELVHRQFVKELKDLVVVPVAGVKDRLRPKALRHRADGLDEQRQLIEARRERGLVDLDDLRSRGFEAERLLMQQFREREARLLPRPVELVERPVHHRVRPRDHALHRPLRARLGELEPVHADRTLPPELVDDDRFLVVPVAVGANQAGDLRSVDVLGEVRGHVASVLLAVHGDVDPDLLLEVDPLRGRLLLEGPKAFFRQLALGGLRPRPQKVFGLRERTDARRQETRHEATPTLLAAADTIRSFSRARSRGRNSRPFEGDRNDAFRSIRSLRLRTFLATSAGSSLFVLRASTRPRTSGFFEPCFATADQVPAPWTRSRPIASAGVSTSSSKIFETSPKYVKRVSAAAPFRARMRSRPSTASGRSSGCRVRIGSSIWMWVAPARTKPETSSPRGFAASRAKGFFLRQCLSSASDARGSGPVRTGFTGAFEFACANFHSSTRIGSFQAGPPWTTG